MFFFRELLSIWDKVKEKTEKMKEIELVVWRWNKTIERYSDNEKNHIVLTLWMGRVNDKWFVYDISPQEIDPASVDSSTTLLIFPTYAVDLDIFEVGENILPRIQFDRH